MEDQKSLQLQQFARVAHPVEHLSCKQEVASSSLAAGSLYRLSLPVYLYLQDLNGLNPFTHL